MAEESNETQTGPDGRTVVVVGPDGAPIGTMSVADENSEASEDPSRLVEQPAKVMRIGSMIKQLLEDGLAPELVEELDRLSLPFESGHVPSEPELRIAQAQLVGWLEGLFHGIQAALVAQQMAARVQLEQMRGRPALPMGPGRPGLPSDGDQHQPTGT